MVGDIIFAVATKQTDQSVVDVRCYQGGAFVYENRGDFAKRRAAELHARVVVLDRRRGRLHRPPVYFGKQGRERELASMDFEVAA